MRNVLLAGAFVLLATAARAQLTNEDCTGCHSDASMAPVVDLSKSVHAAAGCTDCHANVRDVPHENASVSRFDVPKLCTSCHGNPKYFSGVHGEGTLQKGLNVSAICTDCHGHHDVLPAANPASKTSHQHVPETCGKCHEGILTQWRQSAHGQLWARTAGQPGNRATGPTCISCHESHGIRHTDATSFRLGVVTECSNCHAQEAPTYRDSFHGQATELGFVSAAKCSDCHTPHLNLPKSDPRSSIHKANLVKTCAKCHPSATANFASFQPHADPHNKQTSPQVYYVYNWLMKWLLIGVFAFFGLHTLLWLQRSIVGAIRGEFPKHESASGRWIIRFKKKHRLTHIAIVVSFLALAATGLPLMYSHQPWGKTLARAFGGVGVSTEIHRIFAIVTMGYALYHLGFLLHAMFIKKERSIFWGPNSMVPRVRDVVDLKNMLKWFFYLGPRPRFDRFTYWEKFDYFAVFWGVPVIGLSGLMLWIPELVTRVLPGWALNVAMLVHGDEALLAIGFIFTFHFFHTHLRPEAFPLDPVMFTGRMPLERFQEERPDEYERLVAEGRLDEFLTSPPTEGQIAFSRWFGFTTLSIGVLLIVAIYVTVFTQLAH
ncbi:MAG TPA: cytochrome c3 family protein [Thermoanaerobaculia bacterium]|nr:cytochrome c3 family protein [Thermoanaerobaculia bacterium]